MERAQFNGWKSRIPTDNGSDGQQNSRTGSCACALGK
jgi:hypothetical protein